MFKKALGADAFAQWPHLPISVPIEIRAIVDGRAGFVDLGSRVIAALSISIDGSKNINNSVTGLMNSDTNKTDHSVIKITLTVPENPFFRFRARIDKETFAIMKDRQRLTCQYEHFLDCLRELVIACTKREDLNVICFTINEKAEAVLVVLEDLGHKLIEALRIDFEEIGAKEVRETVVREYKEMSMRLFGDENDAPYLHRR